MSPTRVKVVSVERYDRFVFRWHDGQRWREKITDIPDTPRNRRVAERAAVEFESTLFANSDWQTFIRDYTAHRLDNLSDQYRRIFHTVVSLLEEICGIPNCPGDVDSKSLMSFATQLRERGKRPATVESYLKTLRAGLNWGEQHGYLSSAPRVSTINPGKRSSGMRARPITTEEYERILSVVPNVRPRDEDVWVDYLQGLWLSGLRLSESVELSWDWEAGFSVDLSGSFPSFRILAEHEKGRRDRVLPMAPEFADFLSNRSGRRQGRVFRLGDYKPDWVGRTVAKLGKAAGVVVNSRGKTASAHDFRRAFATRWAALLTPAELQQLMRHESIETTMTYYVSIEHRSLASKLSELGGKTGGMALPTDQNDAHPTAPKPR